MADSEDEVPDFTAEFLPASKKVKKQKAAKIKITDTSAKSKVDVSDLLKACTPNIKKHLRKILQPLKLDTPLTKPEQQKLERAVVYEKSVKEISVWDPVVHGNRKAKQLQFPLQQPDLRILSTEDRVKQSKPLTKLEQEVAQLLQGSEYNVPDTKSFSIAEERALQAMSIEEAKQRREELQKYRALLSYKEAKARRVKKIKSKRFHKILRKKEFKDQKKLLDDMKTNNPEGFKEELEKIEKQRVKERMTLRHRGGSKKLKQKALFGKFNDQIREATQEMIALNRQLTQKLRPADSEEDTNGEEEEEEVDDIDMIADEDGGVLADAEEQEIQDKINEMISRQEEFDQQEGLAETAGAQETESEVGADLHQEDNQLQTSAKEKKRRQKRQKPKVENKVSVKPVDGTPHQTIISNIAVTVIDDEGDCERSAAEIQRMNIEEAFASDDVIEEFTAEKQAIVEKDRVKDIDLTLPGWGEWAGGGLKPSTRKKRFIIKAPEHQPRKDDGLKHVIISERKDDLMAKHQVTKVPFPYKKLKHFEDIISKPIGKTWNPETIYRTLIEPPVVVKQGTIIDPIDKSALLKNAPQKNRKRKESDDNIGTKRRKT